MADAKEYYNRTSGEYVQKWEKMEKDLDNPKFYFRKRIIEIMLALSGATPRSRLIEIGCGTGLVLREALKITKPVFGIDISEAMLMRVQDSVLRDRIVRIVPSFEPISSMSGADVFLAVDNFEHLKIPRDYFDCILSMEVLRYIRDKNTCFRNIATAMHQGSIFVFTVTNLWSTNLFPLKYTVRKILGRVKVSELPQYFTTERVLRRQLREHGLHIVGFKRIHCLSVAPFIRRIIRTHDDARRWERIDEKIARIPVLRTLFDTFIVAVQKEKEPK